ncbi:family 1 glycosylhydrolase [Acidiplasma sp.]|uniref:family 1 glycosylhydrolase n=1 Tax=Acidiplasma sp. TaxID=1872114 RepID=UPI00258DE504|nr:family 1 glycosylhydrolase [Acidiplasma sp.]
MLRKFVNDFMLGFSINSFQNDQGNDSMAVNTDWYKWSTDKTMENMNYVSGGIGNGPDFWNNFRKYIDKIVNAGLNSVKIGIEWSRIFPESTENVDINYKSNSSGDVYSAEFDDNLYKMLDIRADRKSLEHYESIFKYIRSKNIRIIVTLWDGTLPLWIHDPVECNRNLHNSKNKGWLNKNTVLEFGKYSYYISKRFGSYIDYFNTMNRPNYFAINSYLYGNIEGYPPGLSDFSLLMEAYRNMAYAHNLAYLAIKKSINRPAGLTMEVPYFTQEMDNDNNIFMVNFVKYLYYNLFINSALYGNFDMNLTGEFKESRPYEFNGTDFIGISYYGSIPVRYVQNEGVDIRYRFAFIPCTNCSDDFHEIHPDGIKYVAFEIYNTYRKPVIITENGIATESDDKRCDFIKHTLIALHQAVKDYHINLKGYFYRSLTDTYEWAHGFSYKYGILNDNINFKDTGSMDLYSNVAKNNGIEDEKYRAYE